MADVFNFYVYDDRTIQFEIAEPIMLEDTNVTEFKFRIPKSINGFDMTGWAWWFVYVNPSRQQYSVPLTFTDDEDEPEEYANATYTVDYGMSGTAGTVQFALEAINADATTNEILNEWHTKTYSTRVISTLQGNQTEFTESEFDIISAKLEEIMELIEGGGGGSTSDDISNKSTVTGSTVTDALDSLSDEIANLEGGAPTQAQTVAQMVDTSKVYLYTGSEEGYIFGAWYHYNGTDWVYGGMYGEAASMSAGVKAALMACFQHVAWIDDQGQTYYDNLYNELYPPANLVSISAVYTQSGTVYAETSLDDLKPDLVVTANYSDGTSEAVTTYTLSGTLEVGTSVVTVTYGSYTDTISVVVTHYNPYWLTLSIEDDFVQGGCNDDAGGTNDYKTENNSRCSHIAFDIMISSDYKYTFEYEGTANIGIPYYSEGVLDAVANHQSVRGYKTDNGWKSSGYSFTPEAGSVCMRITFNQGKTTLINNGTTELKIMREAAT